MDDLLDSSEKEYGTGTELSTTGFLIFGLLTFWIYTVWHYYRLLAQHFSRRLMHFNERLGSQHLPESATAVQGSIVRNGFSLNDRPRTIAVSCYLISMLLILVFLSLQALLYHDLISELFYDRWVLMVVGLAALAFTGADIIFLSSVCTALKRHEYHELLYARLAYDPNTFEVGQPSTKFIKRWNHKQNQVSLFIILSIPMTLSPLAAVWHIQHHIANGGNVFLAVIFWSALLFTFAGVFHLWGIHVLITMFNEHLRIEAVNQQHLSGNAEWSPASATSVLGESREVASVDDNRQLIPKRALAAIMFTDMVGFSKDMEQNESSTYAKLLIHNDILRKAIASNHGEELRTVGDAFLVRFDSAVDAVWTAIQIQNELTNYSQDKAKEDQIVIRIGVHIGDILILGNEIIGNGVNVAARIEPLAEPGGICISSDVYNLVRKSIDINAVNLGKRELKNIQDAPEIYKIILESMAREDTARHG